MRAHVSWSLPALLAVCTSLLGGCSAPADSRAATSSPRATTTTAVAEDALAVLAEYEVNVDGATNAMTWRALPTRNGSDLAALGFGAVILDTDGVSGSPAPGNDGKSVEFQNSTDGQKNVGPGSNCGGLADTFCVSVLLRSFFVKQLSTVYVEVTSFTGAGSFRGTNIGDAFAPTMTPVAPPATLAQYLVTPSPTTGLADYGDLTRSSKKTLRWYFGNGGKTDNFGFKVAVKAAKPRVAYKAVATERVLLATEFPDGYNACAQAAHATLDLSAASSRALVNVPFPVTVFDRTASTLCVSKNGYAQVTNACATTPDVTPISILTNRSTVPRNTAFGFWQNLSTTTLASNPAQICTATVGAFGSRSFIVTYDNVRDGLLVSPGVAPTRYVFDMIFHEGTDVFDTVFEHAGSATDGDSPNALGSNASAGLTDSTTTDGVGGAAISCGTSNTQTCLVGFGGPNKLLASQTNVPSLFPIRWRYTPGT